jgi:hypothetical protein
MGSSWADLSWLLAKAPSWLIPSRLPVIAMAIQAFAEAIEPLTFRS